MCQFLNSCTAATSHAQVGARQIIHDEPARQAYYYKIPLQPQAYSPGLIGTKKISASPARSSLAGGVGPETSLRMPLSALTAQLRHHSNLSG